MLFYNVGVWKFNFSSFDIYALLFKRLKPEYIKIFFLGL